MSLYTFPIQKFTAFTELHRIEMIKENNMNKHLVVVFAAMLMLL